MTITTISCYLCVLFALAFVVESAITVAPGGATVIHILMGAWAGLAVLFAAIAVSFRLFRPPQPEWLVRVFQGVALLATAVVILMVIG